MSSLANGLSVRRVNIRMAPTWPPSTSGMIAVWRVPAWASRLGASRRDSSKPSPTLGRPVRTARSVGERAGIL